jgi:hypothetical protein
MHVCRFGPSDHSASDSSSFSGFHDSAASLSFGARGRVNGKAEGGSASGSNNSSTHSGRSNGSLASSGGGQVAAVNQPTDQPLPGLRPTDGTLKRSAMAVVPEYAATVDGQVRLCPHSGFSDKHICMLTPYSMSTCVKGPLQLPAFVAGSLQ